MIGLDSCLLDRLTLVCQAKEFEVKVVCKWKPFLLRMIC